MKQVFVPFSVLLVVIGCGSDSSDSPNAYDVPNLFEERYVSDQDLIATNVFEVPKIDLTERLSTLTVNLVNEDSCVTRFRNAQKWKAGANSKKLVMQGQIADCLIDPSRPNDTTTSLKYEEILAIGCENGSEYSKFNGLTVLEAVQKDMKGACGNGERSYLYQSKKNKRISR